MISSISSLTNGHFWAVVPAAGMGTRMGSDIPKQYLKLGDHTVLEHVISRLGNHPRISGVVVALAQDDPYWPELRPECSAALYTTTGGAERCHSVLNALNALPEEAVADDWVLVHDAARPCLRSADLDLLLDTLVQHPIGGLLGLPVADTMKRTDDEGRVIETVSRENLWRALTPQMFRLGPLRTALQQVLDHGYLVTDEASAMEYCGYRPLMVEGHSDNIKITRPEDLALAELYLSRQ